MGKKWAGFNADEKERAKRDREEIDGEWNPEDRKKAVSSTGIIWMDVDTSTFGDWQVAGSWRSSRQTDSVSVMKWVKWSAQSEVGKKSEWSEA